MSSVPPACEVLPSFPAEKRCSLCGVVKPLEAFARDRSRPDGHRGQCRDCLNTQWVKRHGTGKIAGARQRATDEEKVCARCDQLKPRTEFPQSSQSKDGRYSYCKDCLATEREDNREEINAWHRQYYADNREQLRVAASEHYWDNHDDILARRREQWLALSEEEREQRRVHERLYRRHRYATLEAVRIAAYLWCALRRAREMEVEGSVTAADIHDRFVAQEAECAYCGADITAGYHRDHMVPVIRGGSNWPDNLCLACARCNLSKGAMTADEFKIWRTRVTQARVNP